MNRRKFLRILSLGSGAAVLSGPLAESAVKYFFLNQNPLANQQKVYLLVVKKMLDARIEMERILVEDLFVRGQSGCVTFEGCEQILGLRVDVPPIKHDSYGMGARWEFE